MSISPDELPPVWSRKDETDRCYNQCVKMLLSAIREDVYGQDVSDSKKALAIVDDGRPNDADTSWSSWLKGYIPSNPIKKIARSVANANGTSLPSVGILFGTHNWESAKLILEELVRNGLAEPLPEERSQEDGTAVVRVKPEAVERVAVAQLYGTFWPKFAFYISSP